MRYVSFWLTLFLVQDADKIRAAMQSSLDQQRAAVAKQPKPPIVPVTAAPRTFSSVMLPPPCDAIPMPQLTPMIDNAASSNGLSPSIVREVARQESGFRPCAVSPKGAEGLMQLMPATQNQFQVIDPFDPMASLDAGAKLLKQLLNRYNGDLSLALSAYNSGAGTVDKAGGIPQIPETQSYVSNILSRIQQ